MYHGIPLMLMQPMSQLLRKFCASCRARVAADYRGRPEKLMDTGGTVGRPEMLMAG